MQGTINDIIAIGNCISEFKNTPYIVRLKIDLSAEDIINSINDTFAEAKGQDINLLYFAGHGYNSNQKSEKGSLLGNDGIEYVTAKQLKEALDSIKGFKVIIIDACYGGDFLNAYLDLLLRQLNIHNKS